MEGSEIEKGRQLAPKTGECESCLGTHCEEVQQGICGCRFEAIKERWAIREFDGGIERHIAEWMATDT